MILECEAYSKLIAEMERDGTTVGGQKLKSRFSDKLQWILDRAQHYAEVLDVSAEEVLTAWEGKRNYWYMNFYQECNQPLLTGLRIRVFKTLQDLAESVGQTGFRCPHCNGVSTSSYQCDSGVRLPLINSNGVPQICNWSVGGLFRDLGKGVLIFVKEKMAGEQIFMPIAWEEIA